MNLFDAFRLLSESKDKLSKPKGIKRETPSIEVEAAALLAYTETAIRQQTPCVYCTIDFLAAKLGVCDKRVRLAKKHLEELGLLKDQFVGFRAYVLLLYHIPELKGKKASSPPLTGEPAPGSTGDGDPGIRTPGSTGEANTLTLEVNTHSLDLETKTKTTHTCVSDREKGLEEERQDGRNQIAKKEELLIDEVEVRPAYVKSERKNQMADSQMAKAERQDGKIAEETEAAPAASSANSDTDTSISQTKDFTKDDFVRSFANFFGFDEFDENAKELSEAWLRYETSFKHYPQVDYWRLSKFLESRNDFKDCEQAFLGLICMFKPSHIARLRYKTDEIFRSGFDMGNDQHYNGAVFIANYCNIEQFVRNWELVKMLTPEIMAKVKDLETSLGKPELWQIRQLSELSVMLDKENSSLDHYLEWFQDLRYDREDIQFTWATTLSKMQTQHYLSSTRDERRTRAEIKQERVDRAGLLERIRKDAYSLPELGKLADDLENCRITIGKARNEYEATLNGYGLR